MKTPCIVSCYWLHVTRYLFKSLNYKSLNILLLSCFSVFGQTPSSNPNGFRITFTDKINSLYSINRPEEFLSSRAIAKRLRFNIPITVQDIPVNSHYIDSILNFSKVPSQILSKSKWDNSVVIFFSECENSQNIIDSMVSHFSFIKEFLPVAHYKLPLDIGKNAYTEMPYHQQESSTIVHSSTTCDYDYGKSIDNIKLHKGELLHKAGFCGEGMLICVNDGGFENFNTIPYFQPLYQNGQIWGTHNFVPELEDLYMGHSPYTGHGTVVLSMMASTIEGQLIGSAPKASYFLMRTCIPFDNKLTNLAEEDFFACAAEFADSIGADVMTQSLGNRDNFDFDWQNIYTPADNDGKKSIASRAASILGKKGVIFVKSAGNEGLTKWKYITRPADAFDILAVGMVDINGLVNAASSYGPSADGRVKPDVAALGVKGWAVNYEGNIVQWGNGTSASAPIIAGLSACLWQALPQYSSIEIMQFIREYGDRANNPNNRTGYGIPNFYQCYLDHYNGVRENEKPEINLFPNPTAGELRVKSFDIRVFDVEVFDVLGIKQKAEGRKQKAEEEVEIDISHLQTGIYFLRIQTGNGFITKKIVKL